MRDGATRTYPSFPEIEADLGYNPARYLAQPVDADPVMGETATFATTWAVIRGLQEVHTIRQWCTVEAELGRGQNGGPRQRVIKKLNERKRQIEHDDASQAPSQAEETTAHAAQSEADDNATAEAATESDDDAVEPPAEATPPSAAPMTSTETAVATAGGEEPPLTPRCPDCQGELDPEEIDEDEIIHWCSYCGKVKEPLSEAAPTEATA